MKGFKLFLIFVFMLILSTDAFAFTYIYEFPSGEKVSVPYHSSYLYNPCYRETLCYRSSYKYDNYYRDGSYVCDYVGNERRCYRKSSYRNYRYDRFYNDRFYRDSTLAEEFRALRGLCNNGCLYVFPPSKARGSIYYDCPIGRNCIY